MTVSCPNLPKIIAVDEEDGEVSVLEEYVQGDTLFYILQGGVLSEKEAADIVVQLCEGLYVLHGLGVVHRDVKPENIIIRGNEAVLIDFDASRMVDPEKNADTRILGTTGFAAPEQYGISQTDARADIYSVGVLLNIMLTGEHPSIRLASGRLGDIIQKCTMISPEKRYQSAKELGKAIESAQQEQKKQRKNLLWGLFSVAAAVAIFAGIIFAVSGGNVLPQENGNDEFFEDFSGTGIQNVAVSENDFAGSEVKWLELSGWEEGTGESGILPQDFYEYWDKSEFISAEQIKISTPGNIENYLSYEFSDDILRITVNDIPEAEWKLACLELGEGQTELFLDILIEAPSENITGFVLQQGNGEAYSMMKKQAENGFEYKYVAIDPEKEYAVTDCPFAEIIEDGNGKIVIPASSDSIFYGTVFWKDDSGKIMTRIIPYTIIVSDEAKTVSIDETEYETWMDLAWEPISDPRRIVYKNVSSGEIFNVKYLDNRGIELSVFDEPGYIRVDFLKDEKVDVEILANLEAIILPPDARAPEDGESIEEYLKSVYAETEYAGFKVNSTDVSRAFSRSVFAGQLDIIDNGTFRFIEENEYCSSNIIPMDTRVSDTTKTWYTKNTGTIIIIIDWYKDNIFEKPNARPVKREYIYNDCGSFVITENIQKTPVSEPEPAAIPSPGTVIASGYCGENGGTNLNWSLDSNGILTISGNGRMADYDDRTEANGNVITNAPWGNYKGKAKYLVIEEGVTSVGMMAFHCMKISGKLELPSTIERISFWSFCGNSFGGSLEIPEGCTEIGQDAFQTAGNFSTVYIPSTVSQIGYNPFRYCLVNSFSVSESNQYYCSVDGGLYDKAVATIIACPDGRTGTLNIPKSVTRLERSAFERASAARINIMGDISYIEERAFQGYNGEVAFYGNVGNISADAFSRFTSGVTVYFLYNGE